ncbi:hypothetical protein [Paenibacillus illinoisensis]|uniref:hypothetical protein n=1 Tax=Paenibacillus illinoisensis TaxID=59845 RepID=UPI003016A7DB
MSTKKMLLSGFPKVGDKVELPNIASLLAMPWFQYADADEVYRHGGDIYRNLLDKIPLMHNRKHVLITSRVQLLSPSKVSIKFVDRWHTDGSGSPLLTQNNDITHLLISKCSAVTQFNSQVAETDFLPENISQMEFNHYIEENKDRLGLVAQDIEAERFVTFGASHAHRAVLPKELEFRFMFRVIESDIFQPASFEQSLVTDSFTYNENPDGTQFTIDKFEKTAAYKSIEQLKDKVIINL